MLIGVKTGAKKSERMSSATAVHRDSLDGLRKDTVNKRLATLILKTFPRTMNQNK